MSVTKNQNNEPENGKGQDPTDYLRQTAIDQVEGLWPPDSQYPETAAIGQQMLMEAIAENWRHLPLPILQSLARKNQAAEFGNR